MSGARHIGVLGAGAWGTALALAAARAGARVTLWARREALAREIAETRENAAYLPGVNLPDAIAATAATDAFADCDALLSAVPVQAMRATFQRLSLAPEIPLILCAKGIERATARLPAEIAAELAGGRPIGALSGPSFAADVAAGLPTAVAIAMPRVNAAREIAEALASRGFRPYFGDDVRGLEIGGAVKNVLAIACGVVEGRGLGLSARAALTARGFAEMARFGRALGARAETLGGLSGMGDLVLTASSVQSRNYAFGAALGRGLSVADALAEAKGVVEGAATAEALIARAAAHDVAMPISTAVADIVAGSADVETAITHLLNRPLAREI